MDNNKSFFIIGFIVFASIILFIFGNLYLQNKSFNSQNYTFNVLFENIQGLHEGDEVKILGKKIGKVKTTMIYSKNIILAELIIDNAENQIPIDSKIEIKSEGFLGTRYISISLGKNENDFIVPGSNVSGTNREVDLSEITNVISPIADQAQNILQKLEELLIKEEIDSIIVNIESLTDNMNQFADMNKDIISEDDKKKVKSLINDLSETSSGLKDKFDNDITDIINNMNSLFGNASKIKEFMENLNDISVSLDSSANDINNMIANIEKRNNTLGKLIYEDSLYVNLNELIKEAHGLIQDIEDNPSRYMKSIFK